MYSGTLINDLFAAVERVQSSAPWARIEPADCAEAARSAEPSRHAPGCGRSQSPNSSRSRLV